MTLSSFQASFQNDQRIAVRAAEVGVTSHPAVGTGSLAEMSCALAISDEDAAVPSGRLYTSE